jgi:hypothetical protein
MTTVMPGAQRLFPSFAHRRAARAEHRREIAADIAVHQIVDNGEGRLFDHCRRIDDLLRRERWGSAARCGPTRLFLPRRVLYFPA